MEDERHRKHIYLGATGKAESYTSPSSGGSGSPDVPERNRQQHGKALLAQLRRVEVEQAQLSQEPEAQNLESPIGIQVEFEGFPDVDLAVASLADARSKIELTNVRHLQNRTLATIFVPEGKLTAVEAKFTAYMEERKDAAGRPRDHRKLVDAISSFRAAALEALWTDDPQLLPADETVEFWWEVWLPVRDDRQAMIRDFRHLATSLQIQVAEPVLEFPERSVLLAKGTRKGFTQSGLLLNCISEVRRAKETAAFFDELEPREQQGWTQELLGRLQQQHSDGPFVCILDTGVNNGHPLISPFQADADQFSIEADGSTSDDHGHGTGMAGLAIWGDMTEALDSTEPVHIGHRIESVRMLGKPGDNEGRHHGIMTADAASLVEIANPERTRVFTMAVSTTDGRDHGRPSAWSGTIDSLASDALGEGAFPRLFLLAGGNTGDDLVALKEYPTHNLLQDIHDPGQAWNTLTVGAFTAKTTITERECSAYQPLAPEGGLSPYSTTSTTWQKTMPLKPDVVFEGGNVGLDSLGCAGIPSLKLLTTYNIPLERLFTTFEATSAATALASRFAVEIRAQYPTLWPETVRALMVHSADWTDAMRQQFAEGSTARQRALRRVRCVGFGVPDLDRAMWSASNTLALIVEDELQPFEKAKGGAIGSRDMHLHDLPWPKSALQQIGDVDVELVVTLSYFVEPNPSSRNVAGQYSYASHQLRFDVKRPLESLEEFRKRINRDAWDSEHGRTKGPSDPDWLLGRDRHRGSIHKDIWRGKAAALAERGQIAVYPAMGWWRTRKSLQRYDKKARYALVVSIRAPEVDVDLYSEVLTRVAVPQTVAT